MPYFRLHRAFISHWGNYHNNQVKTNIQRMTNNKNADPTNSSYSGGGTSYSYTTSAINQKISKVFELFNNLFQTYSADEVFVSFNGGKDCTVVLDLVCQYFKENEKLSNGSVHVLYIRPKNPFKEVEDFVAQCKQNYPLKMIEQAGSIKPVLESVCSERPKFKAVLMGVRRTDPQGRNLKCLQETDPGWPPLLRVNPILDWTFADVWNYLLEKKVAYCCLYNMGYTSLGETTNTRPNKNLIIENPKTGEITYRPAYEMMEEELEREGRC